MLAAYLARKHDPWSGGSDPSQILIADVLSAYHDDRVGGLVRQDLANFCIRSLGHFWKGKTLTDVTTAEVRAYVRWRCRKGASAQTARRDLEVFRAAIRHYCAEQRIPWTPNVPMPKKAPRRERWLTRSEVARLLWAAWRSKDKRNRHIARFMLIGVYTGTRSSAILALKWHPSPTSGWIDLDRGLIYRRGQGVAETKKRQPPAPIPPRLRPHLERWHAFDAARGFTSVVHFQGRQIKKLRRSWQSVRDAAGLESDVVPHVTRHTAATWAMQAGASLWEAAGFLGMDDATLRDIYGHHHPDYLKEAAERIGSRAR